MKGGVVRSGARRADGDSLAAEATPAEAGDRGGLVDGERVNIADIHRSQLFFFHTRPLFS